MTKLKQKLSIAPSANQSTRDVHIQAKADLAIRYRLLDQRLNNTVQIYDAQTEQYSVLPALSIVKDRKMIRAFYPDEACMIGLIAGQACAEAAAHVG